MVRTGTVLQGRYEVLKEIGRGGMSTVYQARDLTDGKLLAVKDVARSGREQNQLVEQSLTVEGRMLKNLSNPHLPKIYEILEDQDNFVLIMDYIQGESLDKVIARQGAQRVERVLDWGMQICEVFHYLHSQPVPVIYRDMKPANVMLQPNGQLVLIDFGTARTQKVGVAMKADTVCIGTEGFAAPEQFGGIGQSTARTDIFCLGATLYNMVTGHSPCDKPKGILPLEYWDPKLADTPIAQIIAKCTRNDPDERYQSAMELYEDLRLASIGAYKPAGKKGKTGGFRRAEERGSTGMLSDAISSGLSGFLAGISTRRGGAEEPSAQPEPLEQKSDSAAWRKVEQLPLSNAQTDQSEDTSWGMAVPLGLGIAAVCLILCVALAALNYTVPSLLFLIVALGAVAVALAGIYFARH